MYIYIYIYMYVRELTVRLLSLLKETPYWGLPGFGFLDAPPPTCCGPLNSWYLPAWGPTNAWSWQTKFVVAMHSHIRTVVTTSLWYRLSVAIVHVAMHQTCVRMHRHRCVPADMIGSRAPVRNVLLVRSWRQSGFLWCSVWKFPAYIRKDSRAFCVSSFLSFEFCWVYPLLRIIQTVPWRAIRGISILVNSTPLLLHLAWAESASWSVPTRDTISISISISISIVIMLVCVICVSCYYDYVYDDYSGGGADRVPPGPTSIAALHAREDRRLPYNN